MAAIAGMLVTTARVKASKTGFDLVPNKAEYDGVAIPYKYIMLGSSLKIHWAFVMKNKRDLQVKALESDFDLVLKQGWIGISLSFCRLVFVLRTMINLRCWLIERQDIKELNQKTDGECT